MGDGALSPNISDSVIDFDLVHELLSDNGFWLGKAAFDNDTIKPVFISTQPKIMVETVDASLGKRLARAMGFLRETIKDKDVLVQIWLAVRRQGRQVLTASDQPFSVSPSCRNLASYRDASLAYQFAADEELVGGFLGRVFLHRLPEWTPDVRFFRREEYPRVGHAQECDVRGSLALPLLELGSGACLGVLEIVTTRQRLDFHPELLNVCKALEAVDLKSSNILSPHSIEPRDDTYEAALAEIRSATRFACGAYGLPLAQVWASCLRQRRGGGCRHSDENYARCLSTVDSACCVADPAVAPFHEACSRHHLLRGEGLPGRAALTNRPCYAEDVAAFSKTEYPLAHHARVFGLRASAAIRLRSARNVGTDFVFEFFLPGGASEPTLRSLSSVLLQMCSGLRAIADDEMAEDNREDGAKIGLGFELNHPPQEDSGARTSGESLDFGSDSIGGKKGGRKHKRSDEVISLDVLRQHFAGSLKEAARSIGVCPTTLKRICRHHGITRWPSRKIKKVSHSLRKLQLVIDSVHDGEGPIQLSSFYDNFPQLVSPDVAAGGAAASGVSSPKINDKAAATTSSSGSHTSSSSNCCSTGVKHPSLPVHCTEQNGGPLKKARSDAELAAAGHGQEARTRLMIRSYSQRALLPGEGQVVRPRPGVPAFRARVAYGEEKIRLSLQPDWDFKHLRDEIMARFSIDSVASVSLKYLDDDAEWVLLTCDDDLEECRDIHRSSTSPTINLSVNRACHSNLGSFGSDGPSLL